MILFMTGLDTTWRAFVPTLGGTFLGLWLDSLFGTAPYLLIGTMIVGFALSVLLIALQIRDVRKGLR